MPKNPFRIRTLNDLAIKFPNIEFDVYYSKKYSSIKFRQKMPFVTGYESFFLQSTTIQKNLKMWVTPTYLYSYSKVKINFVLFYYLLIRLTIHKINGSIKLPF